MHAEIKLTKAFLAQIQFSSFTKACQIMFRRYCEKGFKTNYIINTLKRLEIDNRLKMSIL